MSSIRRSEFWLDDHGQYNPRELQSSTPPSPLLPPLLPSSSSSILFFFTSIYYFTFFSFLTFLHFNLSSFSSSSLLFLCFPFSLPRISLYFPLFIFCLLPVSMDVIPMRSSSLELTISVPGFTSSPSLPSSAGNHQSHPNLFCFPCIVYLMSFERFNK